MFKIFSVKPEEVTRCVEEMLTLSPHIAASIWQLKMAATLNEAAQFALSALMFGYKREFGDEGAERIAVQYNNRVRFRVRPP